MKVVLPDNSELELPDGATGLDAARAIGPKLAEQAVLIRANGQVQDLRLPLARRRADPDPDDARQGRPRRARRPAPLLGASARRGRDAPLSGREDRDRAADRERLLLRLRLPRADPRGGSRGDRGGDPARAEGRPRLGARGDLARRGEAALRASEPYKVELVDTAEGDISLYTQRGRLHRSLPRPAPAELEADQGAQAHRPRRRVLARRLGEPAADAHLRHGVLLAGGPRRVPRAARAREGPRPPAARPAARPLPPLRALAGLGVLAPEGDGDLERARGSAPAREREARLLRGEDAADLRRRALEARATGRSTATTCSASSRASLSTG